MDLHKHASWGYQWLFLGSLKRVWAVQRKCWEKVGGRVWRRKFGKAEVIYKNLLLIYSGLAFLKYPLIIFETAVAFNHSQKVFKKLLNCAKPSKKREVHKLPVESDPGWVFRQEKTS